MRNGIKGEYGLEELFHSTGVDIFINGHEHNYERMQDIYKSNTNQLTTNMRATTYIVTGAAGNREGHEPFTLPQPKWSAVRANLQGYSKLTVLSETQLHWQQYATQKESILVK